MSDFEDFFHFRSKADYLHCSAVLDHCDVHAREFAVPRTIQIDQATKIENDIFPLRFQKRLNGLTQGSDFEKSQMSGHINQGHLIAMADVHRKAHEKQPFRLHGNYNPTVHKRLRRICRLQKAWALQFIAAGPRTGRSAKTPRVRRAQLAFGDSGSAGEFPLLDESAAPAPLNTRQAELVEAGGQGKNRSAENLPAQDGA